MSAESMNKLAEILLYCLLLTAVFSFFIMIGGKRIFKKASRTESSIFYPLINLFIMLEITETSIYWGILFFVPIVNVLVLIIMFYRLGIFFNTSFPFKLGLAILPIIFYPILAFSNRQYKAADEEYFKLLDGSRKKKINLMTPQVEEPNKNVTEEDPKVDSIFKSEIEEKQASEPYKAVRIDVLGLNKLKQNNEKEINIKEKSSKTSKNKKDDVEYIDL